MEERIQRDEPSRDLTQIIRFTEKVHACVKNQVTSWIELRRAVHPRKIEKHTV